MKDREKNKPGFVRAGVVFVLWLIINIRVEAGVGTPFERALDGLVGGAVLLLAVFLSLCFFKCDRDECGSIRFCLKQ